VPTAQSQTDDIMERAIPDLSVYIAFNRDSNCFSGARRKSGSAQFYNAKSQSAMLPAGLSLVQERAQS